MNTYEELGINLLSAANNLKMWSLQLLEKAPLNAKQRSDIRAIHNSAREFDTYLAAQLPHIGADSTPEELQRVRHDLLNHLNIVVGFSKILIREMPDNLLLHMITIRNIMELGESLIDDVRMIR